LGDGVQETYGFDKVPCSSLVGSYNLRSNYSACWVIDASRVNLHGEEGKGKNAKAFYEF
jgi:hypothetical protein